MFFVSFFDSEVQEVVPLMQEEPHDVGWYDTRRHEKKLLLTAYFVLIIWERFLLHSIRRGRNRVSGYQELDQMDSVKRRTVNCRIWGCKVSWGFKQWYGFGLVICDLVSRG